jgi:Flp pilus assembly protein TadG
VLRALGRSADRHRAARPAWSREDGQATVELVAAVPALLLAALISLQLLAAGYALTLADGAAEAGALALAEGGSAAEAARRALPGWADDNVSVSVAGEEVSVRLRPPSPFGSIADHLAVTSSASARAAE